MFKAILPFSRFLPLILSLTAMIGFLSGGLFYLFSVEWIDHVEPLIASLSWVSIHGTPIYHSIDSAERYSNLYGPFLYFFTGGFLKIFGPSFFSAKLGAFVAGFCSFVLMFFSLREKSMQSRGVALGWLALIYLSFAGNVYWIRAEPWMLAFVMLSIVAAVRMNFALASLVWAIAAVSLVHLKLHAAIYALPSLALFFQRAGVKPTLRALILAALLLPLPFLLISTLSFQNLMLWIQVTSQHGIEIRDIFKNLAWCLLYALPMLWVSDPKAKLSRDRIFFAALILSCVLASTSGALRGAGKYHILPLLPYWVYWVVNSFEKPSTSLAKKGIALTATLVLIWNAQRVSHSLWLELKDKNGAAYVTELREILDQHPKDWVQMGFGYDYAATFYRPILIFRQNRIFMDGATLMDFYTSQLEYTPATLEQIRHCTPSLWVFAKGDIPFDLRHVGSSEIHVFRPEIQGLFFKFFEKTSQTPHFDLWTCKDRRLN